jgi:galactokinase
MSHPTGRNSQADAATDGAAMNRVAFARAAEGFRQVTGRAPDGVWAAPGRVNLIGEHTDYSGGLVLPMALPQVCLAAAAARDDGRVTVHSRQRQEPRQGQPGMGRQGQQGQQGRQPAGASSFPVTVRPGQVDGWAGYVMGIVWALREAGHPLPGADLVLDSQVPIGAGLSSSAAIGCSVVLALRDLFDLPLDRWQLAAIARRCENEFVGAPTGAMDQLASLLASQRHLLFLDTRSMRVEQVPFELDRHGLTLLVIDSQTRHELSDGGYGSRRRAVEDGAQLLGVPQLRDVPAEELKARLARIADRVIARRVRHVITENARVWAVANLLRRGGDPRTIGPILSAGHRSLRDDFEISMPQLDTAVEAAELAGAYGARMTGGGFGGSAITLVDTDAVERVQAAVDAAYSRGGYRPARYLGVTPASGARRLDG